MLETTTTSEFVQAKKAEAKIEYFDQDADKEAENAAQSEAKKRPNPTTESLAEIRARQDAEDLARLQKKASSQKQMTFKEREARKRKRGQVSRNGAGGSYVENEKRLLREMSKSDSVRL
mmetsp:Transcript_12538/g.22776  ORF Transcript_12538/g.22776 Transcript_12538/m.22776 type:complete len:119 (+) Transcript_12538:145-501(+)